MDQFFASLLVNEAAIIGIALALMIAGGIAAGLFLDIQATLRRVTYLWAVVLIGLGLTASQFLWVLTPAAADAGLLSLLAIVAFSAFAAFGAALYAASAARSRHIEGDTSLAWMAFVPLINLWLIFRSGRPDPDSEARPRSPVSRFVLDPILVLGALLVLVLGQGIDHALQDVPLYDATDSVALRTLMTQSQTLEESFATEARLTRADLPIRIDEITVLSEIEARGRTLRITYDVEREIPGFRSDFETTLAAMQCAPEMFAADLARGGTIEMVYRAPDGRIIATFEITAADCPA